MKTLKTLCCLKYTASNACFRIQKVMKLKQERVIPVRLEKEMERFRIGSGRKCEQIGLEYIKICKTDEDTLSNAHAWRASKVNNIIIIYYSITLSTVSSIVV
jgi:hypothetical protein